MIKRGWACIISLVLILMIFTANASGLFPSMDNMFGTAMPSVGLVIGREADTQEETEDGSRETYLNFDNEDYLAFGQYLSGIGSKVEDYKVEDNTITAIITVRDASITFLFNWAEKTAEVIYPSGTRAETEKETVEPGESILPPVGGAMPSAEFAINRKPDEQMTNEEGTIQAWNRFSDEDYTVFSAYLAETGAELKNSSIDAGILNAEISLNGFSFHFIFNWNAQKASVIYPEGTTPESSRWNTPVGSGSTLPEISSLGKELPRISAALKREPSSEETLQDGSLQEIYLNFSEVDYNTFSQYLQKTSCSLEEYHTDDNGVLVISLTNGSGKMTFSYDAVRHTGAVTYPGQTRIEKAWAVTPTPEPATTPKPTTSVYSAGYSENECYSAAKAYLKSVLKNPESLQIHSYETITYDDTFCFVIDYSAQNSFGGYTRSDAYIWITKATKAVYWSDFK